MRITVSRLALGMGLAASPASAADNNHAAIGGLMGTTMFASRHCGTFEVNQEKFSTFLKGFGVTEANDTDLLDLETAMKVEKDLEKQGDPVKTCDTLWLRFGAKGSVGARLFRLK